MRKFKINEKQRLGELALRRHLEGGDKWPMDLEAVLQYLKDKQGSTAPTNELVVTIRLPQALTNIFTVINELINRPAAASTPAPSLPEIFVREQRDMRQELDELKELVKKLTEQLSSKPIKEKTKSPKLQPGVSTKGPVFNSTLQIGDMQFDDVPCRMWHDRIMLAYDALTEKDLIKILMVMREHGYDITSYKEFRRSGMLSFYYECRKRAGHDISHKEFIDILGLL